MRVVYGINPVWEALRSEKKIEKIILSRERTREENIQKIFSLAEREGIKIVKAKKRNLDLVCQHNRHQGIAAFVLEKELLTLDSLIAKAFQKDSQPTLAVLDGIQDPRNLGSIIRSAECLNIQGLIIPKNRAAGITAAVAKSSAGAVEYISLARVVNIANALKELKRKNFYCVGIDQNLGEISFSASFKWPLALVLGGEGKGIRPRVKKECDFFIRIPLQGEISSLNVAVASAIIFYEISRIRSQS